jgi:hypothetical protein
MTRDRGWNACNEVDAVLCVCFFPSRQLEDEPESDLMRKMVRCFESATAAEGTGPPLPDAAVS